MVKLIVLFLFVQQVCSLEMWNIELPVVASNLILEEDKPIQIHSNEKRVQMIDLQGTLHPKSLSELSQVIELRISMQPLKKVEPGAICSAPKLKKFGLLFWQPEQGKTKINKESFNNCDNLEELLLATDYSDDLELNTDIFENLTNLKKLELVGIKENPIKRDYFKNLKSLKFLSLSSASITEIEPDALTDLENLEQLEIVDNRGLHHLPKNFLKGTPKLKALRLHTNNLTGLTWDEFEGLSSLKSLSLEENGISSFDAEKIAKNLPNLKRFTFELNPVDCKKREAFANELRSKLNNKVVVEHKFDSGFYDSCEQES